VKEYLPALIKRKKCNLPSHNLSVDDLVLVVGEKTQRGIGLLFVSQGSFLGKMTQSVFVK